jgi:ABC-type lipoprotein export system ATPase subunit
MGPTFGQRVRHGATRVPLPMARSRATDTTAVVVVTHDKKIIPTAQRIHPIRDGSTHEEAGEGRNL